MRKDFETFPGHESGVRGSRGTARRPSASRRYLLYSHDGVGLGHTCRNLAIARALTQDDPGATVLLATGSDDALQLGVPERVEILKLPSLRKVANEHYAARRLLVSSTDIHRIRAGLLTGATSGFRPDVLLVDKHPLGAGGELRTALGAIRSLGGTAVLGLRDILDEPETVQREWAEHDLGRCIADHYDRVLVYGQRGVFDPVEAYGLPAELARRTSFCGYVTRDLGALVSGPSPRAGQKPLVVATVGGGEDGNQLVTAFLDASVGAPWRAVAVTGPMAPMAGQGRLEELAERAGASLHRFLPNLPRMLGTADVLVCMGGYNTLAEALAMRLRVVCVPRVQPRREQWMRASAFQQLGLLECVPPSSMTVGTLREAIRRALRRSRLEVARLCARHLHLDGAAQAATLLRDLAEGTTVDRLETPELEPPLTSRTSNCLNV